MASITLTGTLLDPTGEVAVGDQIRFTHRTTTGETIQFARSLLIIPPSGMYNFTLEFGLILVEYLDVKDVNFKSLGVVTVNGDTTATDLPALLNSIVPPTDAQLLLFQAILQDTEDARDIALLAAAQQTTLELIASTVIHPAGTVLTLSGFTTSGDGAVGAQWKLNGVTGQTVSQTPAQLGDALLNDGNGNQWAMVKPSTGYSIHAFGVFTGQFSTAEFEAALVGAAGSVLSGRGGLYDVNNELRISVFDSGLKSADGSYLTIKNNTVGQAVLKVADVDVNLGEEISNIRLTDVRFIKSDSTGGQIALKLYGTKSTILDNVSTLGCHTALDIKGMTSLRIIEPLFFAGGGNLSPQADAALITIDSHPIDGGGVIPAFPMSITAPQFSGDLLSDYIFDIAALDGFQMTNGYVSSPKKAHFKLEPLLNDTSIVNLTATGVYFDGINKDTGSENFMFIPSRSVTNTGISLVEFVACNINNFKEEVFDLVGDFNSISVNGGNIVSCKGDMIKSTSTGGNFKMRGLEINNVASDTGKDLANIDGLNKFSFSDNDIINADGGLDVSNTTNAIITENGFTNVPAEISLTNVTKFRTENNTSNTKILYDTSNNSGSFTPVLSFGGSTTGIAYTSQTGSFEIRGSWLFYSIRIQLSSKGSATGDMSITMTAGSALEQSACSVDARNFASGVDTPFQGHAETNDTITISRILAGVRTVATDVEFSNSSQLRITGQIRVN